jgi:hypothetical protein
MIGTPPPSVYPTAPTLEQDPLSGASPCTAAALITSAHRVPAPTDAVAFLGFTWTEFIR